MTDGKDDKCSKCDRLYTDSKVKDYYGNGKRFRCFQCEANFCSKCTHWCSCDNITDPVCTDCAVMRGAFCRNCLHDHKQDAEINRLNKLIVKQMEEIASLRKQK